MSKEERYAQILDILRTGGDVTVGYLAKKLYVSPSTIRRDYQELEARGLLHHTYGKATLNYGEEAGLPILLRRKSMPEAKLKIGKRAAELIREGDIIFIDGSSTALCMVEHLSRFKHLTVVTNGLHALAQLEHLTNLTVYSLGGLRMTNSMALTGQLAIESLARLNIDKCFFSTTGISTDGRLLDALEPEHNVLSMLLTRSAERIYLCDSSKLGRSYLLELCGIGDVDYVISDAELFERIRRPEGCNTVFLKA